MNPFVRTVAPCLLGFLCAVLNFAGQTGEANQNLVLGVLDVAWRNGLLALCWWIGAWGLGIGLTKLAIGPSVRAISRAAAGGTTDGSDRTTPDELAIALGLGAALLLAIDSALGTLGVIGAAGGVLAWLVIAIGVVVGARILRDAPASPGSCDDTEPRFLGAVRWAALGVVAGLLAVSASVAPGWLWSSEFSGFDALSYHLPLPKQWFLAGGAVAPVEGNVYSALPSFVECAFLHLMILRGNPIEGALACQWWSVLCTLATAFVVSRIAARTLGAAAGPIAAIVFLATPWTTVVGSLAYNDMFPVLALGAAWLLAGPNPAAERRLDARAALGLSLLAASAFGAKPSSIFFTAIPMCAIVLAMGWSTDLRRGGLANLRFVPLALAVGAVVLAPWLVRNQGTYGNPVFPFLSGVFGTGPWSAEQVAIFEKAHIGSDVGGGGVAAKLAMIWQQWMGYGFGEAPASTEPWYPLWGILPVLGVVGIALSMRRPAVAERRWTLIAAAMLLLMLAGWIGFTHAKSRFLLASAVPLSIGATALLTLASRRIGMKATTGIACGAMILPITAFLREPVTQGTERRAPALLVNGIGQVTGASLAGALPQLPREEQAKFIQQAQSPFILNYMMPDNAKLVGIGFATPFYILRPIAWSTVWDRGVFDRVVDQSPGTPAAWGDRLRADGYTHAVINPVMLSVWARSGWLNPALAVEGQLQQFAQANTLFARTADGLVIVELGKRAAQGTAGVSGTATPPPVSAPGAGG